MKYNFLSPDWKRLLSVTMLVLVFSGACKKVDQEIATTSDMNISDYLLSQPESYSKIYEILQVTGTRSFLNAYGTYTFFAPTNEAIDLYLKEAGKSSIMDVDLEELKQMVRFHLVEDTISSILFTDGKLRTKTMYGQYLLTGAKNQEGINKILINRTAYVVKPDLRVGNGIIHSIDHVLKPAKLTLAQMIEQDPANSIFTRALKETGLYDSLNIESSKNPDTTKAYLTVMVESDAVLKKAGYDSYEELKAKYSNTGDPKLVNDSLHLFVNYHILPGLKYIPDIITATSHATLSPQDVITSKLQGETVLINDDQFNGIHEPGSKVDRAKSDNTASNGVIHTLVDHYAIKIRFPIAVYWEVTDQPEFKALNGIYRVTNKTSPNFAPGSLQGIRWHMGSISYRVAPEARQFYVFHNDYLFIAALRTNVAANNWIEFDTPLLVKGRYKVWLGFIRRGGGGGVQVSFNGKPLPRVLRLTEQLPSQVLVGTHWTYPAGTSPESLEALGKKMTFGTFPYFNNPNQTIDYYHSSYALLAGTIDVEKTDRHVIRFDAVGSDVGGDVQFDMIHFIPENEDQLWPKFNPDGKIVPR